MLHKHHGTQTQVCRIALMPDQINKTLIVWVNVAVQMLYIIKLMLISEQPAC